MTMNLVAFSVNRALWAHHHTTCQEPQVLCQVRVLWWEVGAHIRDRHGIETTGTGTGIEIGIVTATEIETGIGRETYETGSAREIEIGSATEIGIEIEIVRGTGIETAIEEI